MSLDSILFPEHVPHVCAKRMELLNRIDSGDFAGATGPSGKPMTGSVSLALKEQRDVVTRAFM